MHKTDGLSEQNEQNEQNEQSETRARNERDKGRERGMIEAVVRAITATKTRKTLYHFTRASNLPAIFQCNALVSASEAAPQEGNERRKEPARVSYGEHQITLNAHLRIADRMLCASTTQEQFRSWLNRHVFFWPTMRDCQMMLDTYNRREPEERFAVLACEAYALLLAHHAGVKLTKYDSGSSPRFPNRCGYRKSPDMFLPLSGFGQVVHHAVPTKVSEIKEVLVERRVNNLAAYVQAVYIDDAGLIPASWRALAKPLAAWQADG